MYEINICEHKISLSKFRYNKYKDMLSHKNIKIFLCDFCRETYKNNIIITDDIINNVIERLSKYNIDKKLHNILLNSIDDCDIILIVEKYVNRNNLTFADKCEIFLKKGEIYCKTCGKNIFNNDFNSIKYCSALCSCNNEERNKKISRSKKQKNSQNRSLKLKNEFNLLNYNLITSDNYNINIINDDINICKSITLLRKLYKIYGDRLNKDLYLLSEEFEIPSITYNDEHIKNILVSNTFSKLEFKKLYPAEYKYVFENKFKDIELIQEIKYLYLNNLQNNIPKCALCDEKPTFNEGGNFYNQTCINHRYALSTSKGENEVYDFIKKYYNKEILRNIRHSSNLEIDIYLPDIKLCVEYNGLYWHNENNKDKMYHHNKYDVLSKENNILFIWEDDWMYKNDIVKSIILNKLNLSNKIYARKCIIKDVSYNDAKLFLNENHIQGFCTSKIRLGLYYNDELVSLMTFGNKRMILKQNASENNYELLRFCNKKYTSVVGGASKLFEYFKKIYHPSYILSYANCDISNGNIYEILGFSFICHTTPGYYWYKDKKYHRSNFMKHKLVKMGYDKNLTEEQIMYSDGYKKIYDTGNLKYEINL